MPPQEIQHNSVFPWLSQYASNYHRWRKAQDEGKTVYYRPMGSVESAFDNDGVYFEGRADVNVAIRFRANIQVSQSQLRERIVLVWTAMRQHHILLQAQALGRQDFMNNDGLPQGRDRYYVIRPPGSAEEAIDAARQSLVFLADSHEQVDLEELYRHSQNTGRVFNESETCSKLLVLPVDPSSTDGNNLQFLLVIGHQITDGLTNIAWTSHFVRLLNTRMFDLRQLISTLPPSGLQLPLPQEDLYPAISGSDARKRWFWVLTVVLRHVRKPQPAAFQNPLRRTSPLENAVSPPRVFDRVLNYSRIPPLNSYTSFASIGRSGTRRLHRLCREVKASIGAGCFVLVAISMMELHESRYPNIPDAERMPFIGSFPINPRPFFNHKEEPNSMMLAFSDGVVLPFLSSRLDLDKRIKFLIRTAHRQLSRYQKRQRDEDNNPLTYMSSRGAGRVIAMNYTQVVEWKERKLPPHLRTPGYNSPQGDLTVQPNHTMATCGVSSVGRSHPELRPGRYDLSRPIGNGEDAFVADFQSLKQNVRARDGEFLVGIQGSDDSITANVSYDGNAIDESMARVWKEKMETLLEESTAKL